ncbi:cellulase family glycosylhydrolase [Hymenobacter terrenus]|uniref:cellulase family glycosylhydrolase n=1 Tax=Hymenobacter terrenus TaxID=1629124 RepID=UPI000907F7A4|nr:cellulase family glycosylhydrolase [Hymenobacter terrenus]
MKITILFSPFCLRLRLLYAWVIVFAGCGFFPAVAQTPVTRYGALRVQGSQIVDQASQPVSLAGNSLFWSNNGWGGERYYTANVVGWLKNNWNATIVRAAMGVDEAGGYLENPAREKAKVKAVVDACVAAGLYVIIDWHSHHAEQHQAEAIAFFREMATTYGNTPNVIYEIYNEPLQVSWTGVVKPYAQAVTNAIRAIDPDNLIVVGTPTWSQDVDVAAGSPVSGTNIAYTLHFYAATHKSSLRNKASVALSQGVALFVTEYGTCDASGGGAVDATSTQEWMDFMRANKLSHCNWALNDKSETASALLPGTSPSAAWSDSYLTASGRLVKGYVQNWGGTTTTTPPTTPPSSGAATKVEAESYHVMAGVQTENTADTGGGLNVGWVDAGDWMAYTVSVPTAGTYTIQYRVASPNSSGQIRLEQNSGTKVLSTIAVPNTGGWQNWVTITNTITLAAGQQDIAIGVPMGGYNINWWSLAPATSARPITSTAAALYPNPAQQQLHIALAQPGKAARIVVFNTRGRQVLSQELPASNSTDARVAIGALEPGLYTLRVVQADQVTSTKFEKQ